MDKKTKITAQQFIDEQYATKILLGECRVIDEFPTTKAEVDCIYPINGKLEVAYMDAPDDPCGIHPTQELTVEWLLPSVAPELNTPVSQPQPAPTEADALRARVGELEAELAAAKAVIQDWLDLVVSFEAYGVSLPDHGQATAYVGRRSVEDTIKKSQAIIKAEGKQP